MDGIFERLATEVEALKEEVVKLKASTCTVEENMDYWGSDITGQIRLPADDKDMCILLCAEEVRCSYWTYHTGMCWLKTSDSGRKSHPIAISGSRGCVGELRGSLNYLLEFLLKVQTSLQRWRLG